MKKEKSPGISGNDRFAIDDVSLADAFALLKDELVHVDDERHPFCLPQWSAKSKACKLSLLKPSHTISKDYHNTPLHNPPLHTYTTPHTQQKEVRTGQWGS